MGSELGEAKLDLGTDSTLGIDVGHSPSSWNVVPSESSLSHALACP